MKKIVIAVVLLATSGLLIAAQVDKYFASTFEASVDSIYTSVDAASRPCWQLVDSLIVTQTDSAYGIVTISGVAEISPYDELYIGLGADSVAAVGRANLDTFLVRGDGAGGPEVESMPFCFIYPYRSLATDTLRVFAATKNRTVGYKAKIKDGAVTASISLAVGSGITQ